MAEGGVIDEEMDAPRGYESSRSSQGDEEESEDSELERLLRRGESASSDEDDEAASQDEASPGDPQKFRNIPGMTDEGDGNTGTLESMTQQEVHSSRGRSSRGQGLRGRGQGRGGGREGRGDSRVPVEDPNETADNGEQQETGTDVHLPLTLEPVQERAKKAFRVVSCCGIVMLVNYTKAFGFIDPDSLPEGYAKSNVHFSTDKVRSGMLQLRLGDKVEFSLSLRSKAKPHANHVKLFECKRRTSEEYQAYFETLQELISSEELEESKVSEIISCKPVWTDVSKCLSMSASAQTITGFIKLLLLLDDKFVHRNQVLSQIYDVIANEYLFGKSSNMSTFITSAFQAGDPDAIQLIQPFLLNVLTYVPTRAQAICGLLQQFVTFTEGTLQSFIWKLLRKSVAHHAKNACDADWDKLSLIPSVEELTQTKDESEYHLQPVKVKGPYDSTDEYMDVYLRLLRHDCFSALRDGIMQHRDGKLDPRDLFLYHNIHLVGVHVTASSSALAAAIYIEPQRPVKNWESSRHLMFGNLVCLSPTQDFKQVIYATVYSRELLPDKQIVVLEFFSEANQMSIIEALYLLQDCGGQGIMAESPTYYRAYQPVLKALQESQGDIMFVDEIVYGKSPRLEPAYMSGKKVYFGPEDEGNSSEDTIHDETHQLYDIISDIRFDDSQLAAVKTAMQNRLAIIQGPPGTGKTFIGAQLVRLMETLRNSSDGPVLVVTYKNHCLDEFLKEMLRVFPTPGAVVRIGGQQRMDSELANCHISRVARSFERNILYEDLFRDKREEVQQLREKIEDLLDRLSRPLLLTPRIFFNHISRQQLVELVRATDWAEIRIKPHHAPTSGKRSARLSRWMTTNEVMELIKARSDDELQLASEIDDEDLRSKVYEILFITFKAWLPPVDFFNAVEQSLSQVQHEVVLQNIRRAVVRNENADKDEDEENDAEDIRVIEEERQNLLEGLGRDRMGLNVIPLEQIPTQGAIDHARLFHRAKSLLQNLTPSFLKMKQLKNLELPERVYFVQMLLLQEKERVKSYLANCVEKYSQLCTEKTDLETQKHVQIMKQAKVVGMTITGAAINQQALATLKPTVIIVEEAAEVLEPQLTALLGPWVQHLVLIGDHKQLRPPVESYTLVREYNFDLSLMERMINNNLPYATLAMQNRMRPEFAELLFDIYPGLLSNLSRVSLHEKPLCVNKSMFFWEHSHPETAGRSYSNEVEADMAVRLALFFVQQEHPASSITIIAAYQGQVKLLRRKLRASESKYPEMFRNPGDDDEEDEESKQSRPALKRTVVIHTIDNYQGDENDIIIVSLVRSNPIGRIGFLKTLNRRCVAQSRAKRGMYMIGNAETLAHDANWKTLIDKMQSTECLGSKIPLVCPRHTQNVLLAESATDITLGTFCNVDCGKMLDCGHHQCDRPCQPTHHHWFCAEEIEFYRNECGHKCVRRCYEKEYKVKCGTEVHFEFHNCAHMGIRKCWQAESGFKCSYLVSFTFEECGHKTTIQCSTDPQGLQCSEQCTKIRACSHPCQLRCWQECESESCEICRQLEEAEAEAKRKQEEEMRRAFLQNLEQEIEAKKTEKKVFATEILEPEGDTASEYFTVEDLFTKFVQQKHNWVPVVKKIEKISNTIMYTNWLKARRELVDPRAEPVLKFHGTKEDNVVHIMKHGFKLPKGPEPGQKPPMFGRGIYFATDSSKSAQSIYTKGGGQLIVASLLLGRSKTVGQAVPMMNFETLKQEGYDSLYAKRGTRETGGVRYDEYVIYRPDQALPKYVVYFDTFGINNRKDNAVNTLQKQLLASKSQHLQTYHLVPTRSVDLEDPKEIHFRIVESQFLRLNRKYENKYVIDSVDYYINPKLVRRFTAMQNALYKTYENKGGQSEMVLAFHGTKADNVDSIMKDNFSKEKIKRGLHGWGIYFSEFPDISLGYGHALLLCKVLPGNCYDGSTKPDGFDSNRVQSDDDGRGKMLVVYNPDQILPCYVIHYKLRVA